MRDGDTTDRNGQDSHRGPSGDDRPRDGGGRQPGGEEAISPWEWVVAGASTALVLALIGYLVFLGASAPSSPPMITVRVDTVMAAPGGYVVTFAARNTGGTTARGVDIGGELRGDTGTVEKRSATVHFVPAGATRRGGLFFEHDPARYALSLRADGYDVP